ncbi:hypothetical protein niasHT_031092 [Heterodera trifolii]|uniref:Uncharacterized protein n=1 Tax=Heterodera trifolii TaxID=157864 RepID=A0ABD2IR98_9BILA
MRSREGSRFAQEIRSLVAKAYPDNTLEMDLATLALGDREDEVKEENAKRIQQFRSEIARDFFRANMLPEIKERVMYMEEPQNLMEALTQAKRVEQIQGSLAKDQWRMVQSPKAEVAMAEVNAVRAEFQEFRDQQKTQNDQRFSATQPGGWTTQSKLLPKFTPKLIQLSGAIKTRNNSGAAFGSNSAKTTFVAAIIFEGRTSLLWVIGPRDRTVAIFGQILTKIGMNKIGEAAEEVILTEDAEEATKNAEGAVGV